MKVYGVYEGKVLELDPVRQKWFRFKGTVDWRGVLETADGSVRVVTFYRSSYVPTDLLTPMAGPPLVGQTFVDKVDEIRNGDRHRILREMPVRMLKEGS